LCVVLDVNNQFLGPLITGIAKSLMRAGTLPFSADSFTLNARGSNCTLSIVSRTMGAASSLSLSVVDARKADRDTRHSPSRFGL